MLLKIFINNSIWDPKFGDQIHWAQDAVSAQQSKMTLDKFLMCYYALPSARWLCRKTENACRGKIQCISLHFLGHQNWGVRLDAKVLLTDPNDGKKKLILVGLKKDCTWIQYTVYPQEFHGLKSSHFPYLPDHPSLPLHLGPHETSK